MNIVSLLLTNNCNCDCSYCIQNHFLTKQKEIFKDAILQKIPEKITNINSLMFIGGEPFLYEKKIFEVDKVFDNLLSQNKIKNKPMYIFYTNLTILTVEMKKFLEKLVAENTSFGFYLSIDGSQKTHDFNRRLKNGLGSYKTIKNNYNYLIEKNYSIINITSVYNNIHIKNKENIHQIIKYIFKNFKNINQIEITPELITRDYSIPEKFFYEEFLGITKLSFQKILQHNISPELIPFLKKILNPLIRGGLMQSKPNYKIKKISINWNGDIFLSNEESYRKKSNYNILNKNFNEDLIPALGEPLTKACNECDMIKYCNICNLNIDYNFYFFCNFNKKIIELLQLYLQRIFDDKDTEDYFIKIFAYSKLEHLLFKHFILTRGKHEIFNTDVNREM